jgi:hypothetical protein
MGMYTELVLKVRVKENLPDDVEQVLQFLFNDKPEPQKTPEHPFFDLARWRLIGRCSSFYHTPFSLSRYEKGNIFSRSDLKNYEDEIETFLDWIKPYLEHRRNCIGWSWYEEMEEPRLLYLKEPAEGE